MKIYCLLELLMSLYWVFLPAPWMAAGMALPLVGLFALFFHKPQILYWYNLAQGLNVGAQFILIFMNSTAIDRLLLLLWVVFAIAQIAFIGHYFLQFVPLEKAGAWRTQASGPTLPQVY